MNTSSYKLIPTGGKIAAALCKKCAEGEVGESLIRSGITQASFCAFLAQIAIKAMEAGKDSAIAYAFSLLSGANASAAQKALADCTIEWADGKKAKRQRLLALHRLREGRS